MVRRPPKRFSNRLQANPRPERHVCLASAASALVKDNRLLQKIDVEEKGKCRIIKGDFFLLWRGVLFLFLFFKKKRSISFFFNFFYEEMFCSFVFLWKNVLFFILFFYERMLCFLFCFFMTILFWLFFIFLWDSFCWY